MSTSNDTIQLGKFRFRSTSSNVDIFFQDEVKEQEEVSQFDQEQMQAEYQRGIEETTAKLQPQIDKLTQQVQQQQQAFQGTVDTLTSSLQKHLEELEKQVFDEVCSMSFTLAELILQKEILDKEDVEKIIKQSLQEIHSETKVTIKLSNEDFPHLEEKFTSSRTECISDPTLNSGEAKIDHQHGYLDLTLKSRIEELREHFKNIRSAED